MPGKMSEEEITKKLQGTNLGQIKEIVDANLADYIKAIEGGKLAGTRVRKNMLTVKNLALEIRKEIINKRK